MIDLIAPWYKADRRVSRSSFKTSTWNHKRGDMSRDRDGWQQLTYGKWLRTYRKPCIAVFAILPMSRSEVTAVRNVIFYQHDLFSLRCQGISGKSIMLSLFPGYWPDGAEAGRGIPSTPVDSCSANQVCLTAENGDQRRHGQCSTCQC